MSDKTNEWMNEWMICTGHNLINGNKHWSNQIKFYNKKNHIKIPFGEKKLLCSFNLKLIEWLIDFAAYVDVYMDISI